MRATRRLLSLLEERARAPQPRPATTSTAYTVARQRLLKATPEERRAALQALRARRRP